MAPPITSRFHVWRPLVVLLSRRVSLASGVCRRCMSAMATQRKGLVLGAYEGSSEGEFTLTASSQGYVKQVAQLNELIKVSGFADKKSKSRVFYGLDSEFAGVSMVKLGKEGAGYDEKEELHEGKENVRNAAALGLRQLREQGFTDIQFDSFGDPEAAAEGAFLCHYSYDDMKSKDKQPPVNMSLYSAGASDCEAWERGKIIAEGQNFSRWLMETPANHMTPTIFSEVVKDKLGQLENVTVEIRDRDWAKQKGMNSFLSVSQGSDQPPKFVEVHYKGGKEGDAPFALVGKGITFDSGGISIKPSADMDKMRADMGGAACVAASIYTAARLKLPINVSGFMAMSENLPNGSATKPGDVFTAMNGKTIKVDNTDAEGRLVLADALCYAETFKPTGIIDMATLTGAIMVALGATSSAAFTHSKRLWETIHQAGGHTGDRIWRMPLFKHYTKNMTEKTIADVNNIGSAGRLGGSCTAAAFLKEFVTIDEWMHLDIASVMENKGEVSYMSSGMSGRPTRTVVEFLNMLSKSS